MQHPYLEGRMVQFFLKQSIELDTKRSNQPGLNHKLLTLIGLLRTGKTQPEGTLSTLIRVAPAKLHQIMKPPQ